ncbi:MAG: FAD-dependent oxidoreductase [Planctomycetota bacterium]
MRSTDVLILGQGLAGSTLAWRLREHGLRTIVVDRGGVDAAGRPSSSRIAAGLITPVTGKRLTVAEGYADHFHEADRFYRRLGRALHFDCYETQPAVRLFVSEAERALFEQRVADGAIGEHARLAERGDVPASTPSPWGGFVMSGAARLNPAAYLGGTRGALIDEDGLVQDAVEFETDIRPTDDGVAIPRFELAARTVAFCTGYTPELPACVPAERWAPTKGELLTIEAAGLPTDRVVHRGVWIAPIAAKPGASKRGPSLPDAAAANRYRVGATNEWEQLDSTPTDAARDELLAKLAEAGVTDAVVVDHQAAVRPATSDRKPIVGVSEDGRFAWLNGLGAKGALWAPTYADRLAEQIVAAS